MLKYSHLRMILLKDSWELFKNILFFSIHSIITQKNSMWNDSDSICTLNSHIVEAFRFAKTSERNFSIFLWYSNNVSDIDGAFIGSMIDWLIEKEQIANENIAFTWNFIPFFWGVLSNIIVTKFHFQMHQYFENFWTYKQ